ncbi:MAG TPA: GAF domain-containing protein [Methylomirabilota bacterium]|nr:GAF domain-containing protein [Methylomirabilota bacterium]
MKNRRRNEAGALLTAARAVLENRAFTDAARAILDACRTILAADAGLVAVCAAGGRKLEVLLLDPGSLELDPTARLPAPLGRLCARAAKSGRTCFANDLAKGAAVVPARGKRGPRSVLDSALFAPVVMDGEVAGLLGLFNRPGGFSADDSHLAEVFSEMAAVAMLNSRTVNGLVRKRNALQREVLEGATKLHQAEETFRKLVENLPDLIARFGADLRLLYVSPSVQSVTKRPLRSLVGKTKQELGMSPELVEPWDAALRRVFASGRSEVLELTFASPEGARHFDCRLVPEPGPGGAIRSVLSVARDVTDRRLAYEAEQRARTIADALREATVALTRSLDRESVLVTLLDRLRGMIPFDRGSVMVLDEASRVSVRAVFDGDRVLPLSAHEQLEFDPSDHPIVQGVLASGAAVMIPDLRAHPDWSLPAGQSTEASWLGVPLFARGDVAGLFSLSKREVGSFNEEHLKLAEAMSSQASVAVENAILFQQMEAATLRMRALSRRLVEAQESERRTLARELHDEAGQALASLRFGLRLLDREIGDGGDVTGRTAELMERTDAVIDSLHRLAADLRPASLDHLGLEAALRQYSRSAASKFGLEVHFKARGMKGMRFSTELETALYRVVQEAMANVVRHARATRADVLLQRRGDRVTVMVEDNGVGFEPDLVRRREDRLGLLGLEERAEALGGALTVESAPGAGTTIVVEVPFADPHPDR